jgi:hypothetical protein
MEETHDMLRSLCGEDGTLERDDTEPSRCRRVVLSCQRRWNGGIGRLEPGPRDSKVRIVAPKNDLVQREPRQLSVSHAEVGRLSFQGAG